MNAVRMEDTRMNNAAETGKGVAIELAAHVDYAAGAVVSARPSSTSR